MSDFAERMLVFIAGLVAGVVLGVSALSGLIQSQCDGIGIASLRDGYYNCQKRP